MENCCISGASTWKIIRIEYNVNGSTNKPRAELEFEGDKAWQMQQDKKT